MKPRLTVVGAMIAGLCVMAPRVAQLQAPAAPFELPPPGGPHPIGTMTWTVTDASRIESFAAAGTPRQIEVHAWYPAASRGTTTAPYLRDGLAEARGFAVRAGGPADAYDGLASVRTHAALNAPPSRERVPLLVFSHGYTASASSYTALLEDVASRGYVVLSVVHPYEAAAATLAGGTIVTTFDPSGEVRQTISEVMGEWAREDDTMAAVTGATDRAEQRRLLQEYLAGLRHTGVALRRWTDDLRAALNHFTASTDSGISALRRSADAGRTGVFGHSMGGVAAGEFCLEDRRCRAALNLDGIPQYGRMIDARLEVPFLMVYSARPGRLGASDAIYQPAAPRYYRVDVRDTRHLEFSDMPFWAGPLKRVGAFGTMAPARAAAITRAVVAQYFDAELKGLPSPLLSGTAAFPEVTVHR